MESTIKKDYFWNTFGVFMQNAISPLLLIVVTRVNGIYDSGLFSFAFSVAVIFWMIGIWGGRTYQVSDVKREFANRSYMMARLVLSVLIVIGAFLFAILNHYSPEKTSIIVVLVVFRAVESIADAIHGVLQVNDRLYIAGKSLAYKAFCGFILFASVDVVTKNILLSCVSIVVVTILFTLFYDVRLAGKHDELSFKINEVPKLTKRAIAILKRTSPVFAVIFLTILSLNIPRYFIDMYHPEEIGYFGILAMPITLITLIMVFVLQPKVVPLSNLYENKKYALFSKTVSKLIGITMGLGIVILCGAYLLGIPVLELVFGIDFSKYQAALMIIVTGGIINALVSIFINIFTIIRQFKFQFYTLVMTNGLLVVLSAMWIGRYGLLGGVALYTIVNVLQAVLLMAAYKVVLIKAAKSVL